MKLRIRNISQRYTTKHNFKHANSKKKIWFPHILLNTLWSGVLMLKSELHARSHSYSCACLYQYLCACVRKYGWSHACLCLCSWVRNTAGRHVYVYVYAHASENMAGRHVYVYVYVYVYAHSTENTAGHAYRYDYDHASKNTANHAYVYVYAGAAGSRVWLLTYHIGSCCLASPHPVHVNWRRNLRFRRDPPLLLWSHVPAVCLPAGNHGIWRELQWQCATKWLT